MRISNKLTAMLIATAAAMSGLVAVSGPAQARPAGDKPDERGAVSQPAPADRRPDRAVSRDSYTT